MAFEANLWCYLWDLEDEGIDRALDVIQGELGATGVSVAVVYHSVDHLRPHDGVSPRWFRSAGGVQFQPHASRYRGTRARPAVAEWLKTRNPLAALSEACLKRNLSLRGWVVCCHGSATVAKNPALATKDVFGLANPTWLCPLNPDVQEYLRALVEDLTHSYRLAALELEACGFPSSYHAHAHDKIGVDLGPVGRLLIALCLCESCRQLAAKDGIDIAAVERTVRVDLEHILQGSEDSRQRSVEEHLAEREPLRALLDWRVERVAELVGRLRTACSGSLIVMRSGDVYATGADPKRVAARCDGLLQTAYGAEEAALERTARQVASEAGGPGRVWLGLNACAGFAKDAASLVRCAGKAASMGVAGVNVYNYGMIPPARLPWVKQAIRYGRREE